MTTRDLVSRQKQARTIAHGIIVSYEAELRRTPNMGRSLLEEEITKAIADAEHVSLATALEAKDAEIARLKSDLDLQRSRGYELLATECEKQQSRITDLERQLAEETESNRWQVIDEDNFPPLDVELLLGWWRDWPETKWETAAGLYGSTKGGWVHGQATHWMPLPSAAIRGGAK